MTLVLIGPPGAGKSAVAAVVAERLGTRVRDTDADIVAAQGKPINEIFFDEGEDHFRALERAAVRDALLDDGAVVCLGAGAVMADDTRALLREHEVVFLDVAFGEAFKRIGLNRDRPLLAINPRAALRQLMEARRPLYEEVATRRVETDGKTPEQVAQEVLA